MESGRDGCLRRGGRARTCIMRQAGIIRSIFFVVDFQNFIGGERLN